MAGALSLFWFERSVKIRLIGFLVAASAALGTVVLAYESPTASLVGPAAVAFVFGVSVWMLSSAKTHVTLAILMLYLGLADGVIKMMSNSSSATLGRDLLLYAIVIGIVVKRMLRKQPFTAPPLTGWILAFLGVIAVQLFNPGAVSLSHSVASTRQDLEFVPLFFLGYSVMQSRRRLRGFLVLLLSVAAVNGLVGVVQFSMSPSQLASWGAGYAAKVNGTGSVSARGFVDSSGQARVRPFALGSDMGFGGAVADLAIPGMLALVSLGGNRRLKVAIGVMAIGVVLGVVTSQARTDIIAAVVAVLAYFVLATSSRRALRVLLGIAAGLAITYAVVSVLAAGSNSHLFDRYSSITPTKVFSTAYNYRSGTIAQVPQFIGQFPLGAGIGKTGPAGGSAGGAGNYGLDAESEPNFLVLELGIPGLLLFLAFQLRFLGISFSIRRIQDLEMRLLLAGLAAPLFALFAVGFAGITSTSTPGAPYLWFASGALVYWLIPATRRRSHVARALVPEPS